MNYKLLFTIALLNFAYFISAQTEVEFSGYLDNNANYLTWKMDNPDEFDHFQIEKEGEDGTYVTIGDQILPATSTINDTYTFRDELIYPGRNNYRLKMVRNDGTFEYAGGAYIFVEKLPEIHVYPLPATDLMTIELSNFDIDTNAEIRLIDASGVPVWRRALFPSDFDKITVNVQKYVAGNYVLEIVDEDFRESTEVVIR